MIGRAIVPACAAFASSNLNLQHATCSPTMVDKRSLRSNSKKDNSNEENPSGSDPDQQKPKPARSRSSRKKNPPAADAEATQDVVMETVSVPPSEDVEMKTVEDEEKKNEAEKKEKEEKKESEEATPLSGIP
jgi:hypothetical protein